jgi:uncharacterized membrane protein
MSTLRERFQDNLIGIVTLLILGAGFVALFAEIDYFYVIWILGFAVVVPIVAMLFDEDDDTHAHERTYEDTTTTREAENDNTSTASQSSSSTATQDALSILRERYASGDLTDEQFERKLDRLLETETPENAAEWRGRTTREVETEY